jgi:acrylyl-CoA reductase (NADPH)
MTEFRALMLRQSGQSVTAAVEQVPVSSLPDGEVLVRVTHSSLNYKDGMVLGGLGRLVRSYPHIPGIDLAGVVESSTDPRWTIGQHVICTGWRMGETSWGGYGELAALKADWLVPLPAGMTARQAMAIGTAGFTAMIAVMALEAHGLTPAQGEVLVTGAAGGVGSVAAAILAKLGYRVVGSSGRPETHDYLRALGVAEILDRASLAAKPARPLDSERWAGVVDAVGGTTLATALTQMKYHGSVAACGLAGGSALETTVIPFLLRGVNLLGIDSVMYPQPGRAQAWQRLATDLPMAALDSMIETIGLAELPAYGTKILAGQTRGRVVVDLGK